MRPYRITLTCNGKRHSYNAIAASWFDAWLCTVDEFGIVARIVVKPV